MLDEYRLETTSVGEYIDSVEEKYIKVDQAVQREFCWSNEMINNLVYSTVSKKRIYIPNLILAEENKSGIIYTFVVDGGQRTEALRRFMKENHKISKSIRNRYVEYQGKKEDENGNILYDENGDPIMEMKIFDLVGKTYDDFPNELKKRMRKCTIATAIYQNCTPEETSELVMLYNSTANMTVSQKSLTYIGKFADKIKKIKQNNRFLIDCTMLNENDKKKGNWERVISECVMAMFYFDNWKKNPKDICAYLNENAVTEDFEKLEELFNKLTPYCNKLEHMEVAELFTPKDLPVWMMLLNKITNDGISEKDFGRFLLAFNDMKEIKVDEKAWIEWDADKHTKDRKVMLGKMNYLEHLLLQFLHNKEELDDSEMETIDFVRTYVNPDVTEEDIDDYFGYIDSCVNCSRIIKANSDVISADNENAIIAMVAYTYKHDIDMDLWLQRYAISHKTLPKEMSQKDRFDSMLHSLGNFLSIQRKLKTTTA